MEAAAHAHRARIQREDERIEAGRAALQRREREQRDALQVGCRWRRLAARPRCLARVPGSCGSSPMPAGRRLPLQALQQSIEAREASIAAREAAADARVSEALEALAAARQVAQRAAAADLAQERGALEAECARLEAEQRRVADMKQVGGRASAVPCITACAALPMRQALAALSENAAACAACRQRAGRTGCAGGAAAAR